MANTVEILVKGTDQATRTFKTAQEDTKKLGEHAKGASAGMGLLKASIVGVAGAGLVEFLKKSAEAGREAQKAEAQTAAVIKSTGGAAHVTAEEVSNLSRSISNKTGIDDAQIQSSANMLLTFTAVRNEVGKGNDIFNQATQTVTDMSVALGEDGKTAAIQLGKALQDPIKGITALRRVGVAFTDDQKKQIEAMVKTGNVMGAQKLILHELNREFGGSAAAQATAGDKMKATWKNFQEEVGKKLLPLLDKLEMFFVQKIVPALQNKVIPAIMNTAKWITGTLVPALRDQLGPPIQAVAQWIQKTLVPALESLGKWVSTHQDVVTNLAISIGAVIAAAKGYAVIKDLTLAIRGMTLAMAANPILAVVGALILLGTWFVLTYKKSREFRDNVGDAFSDVKIWALETGQWVISYLYIPFITVLSGIVHAAAAAFGWLPLGIGDKLKDAAKKLDGWRQGADRALHGIKADINTEQINMKVRDAKRRIDDIKQNKVPNLHAGTAAAAWEIARLQYWIDHIRGKTIEITTIYTQVNHIFTVQDAASNRGPGDVTSRLATGGPWRAAGGGGRGGWGYINEAGPELVKLPNGSMVIPAGRSREIMRGAGGSGGRVVLEINSGGTRLDDLLVEILRKAVRVRGGNVQLVLGR